MVGFARCAGMRGSREKLNETGTDTIKLPETVSVPVIPVDPVDRNGKTRHAIGLLQERAKGRQRLFINQAPMALLPPD